MNDPEQSVKATPKSADQGDSKSVVLHFLQINPCSRASNSGRSTVGLMADLVIPMERTVATIPINSIPVITIGGFNAEITGLYLISTDCIAGNIGGRSVNWDIYGRCRDHTTDCNIDMRSDVLQELIETIKIMAPGKNF